MWLERKRARAKICLSGLGVPVRSLGVTYHTAARSSARCFLLPRCDLSILVGADTITAAAPEMLFDDCLSGSAAASKPSFLVQRSSRNVRHAAPLEHGPLLPLHHYAVDAAVEGAVLPPFGGCPLLQLR